MQRITTEFRQPPERSREVSWVLAIHGSASSGRQWLALADQLRGVAQVCAPDLPGYGKSAKDTRDRLAALGRMIPQGRLVHLVAHSFGGAIALRLAHAHPGRVASVTLYDPITAEPDVTGRHRLPGALDHVWRCYAGGTPTDLMSRFYDFWATGHCWADLMPHQQARLLRDHAGLCRDMTEITRGDWAIPRCTYRGPLTIFHGQLSPQVTTEMAQDIAGAHPGASVTRLPGMDHFAPLTRAEDLNAYLIPAILANAARAKACAA